MPRKKKKVEEEKVRLRSDQMTLKSKDKGKCKRRNKRTNLQILWEEGKVTSEEFYNELTKFIKWRLMTDLIKRGYYINGVKQNNFSRDEVDSCYTHVLHKIIHEYSPQKGTLATYIRWQIRGWGQLVIQKQVRTYKYTPGGILSLNAPTAYNIKLEECCPCSSNKDIMDVLEEADAVLDSDYFGNSILNSITKSDVTEVEEGLKGYITYKKYFEWLG